MVFPLTAVDKGEDGWEVGDKGADVPGVRSTLVLGSQQLWTLLP